MVLFNLEPRKAWRLLQPRAGVVNQDYQAPKAHLAKADQGEISIEDLTAKGRALLQAETT